MQTETFTVKNVKCGGCVSAIEKGLGQMDGITEVKVDIASGAVTVSGDRLDRTALATRLSELGYPEA